MTKIIVKKAGVLKQSFSQAPECKTHSTNEGIEISLENLNDDLIITINQDYKINPKNKDIEIQRN